MTDKPDYVIELRTIARLIETKPPVTGREQDAEHCTCAMQPPRSSACAKPSAPSARRSSKHLIVACLLCEIADGFEARRHLTASGCYQTVDAYGRVYTRCRSRLGSPRNVLLNLLNGQAGRESL
jgi:hypothetical protein